MRKGGKLEGWKVERLGDVCEIDKIPNRKKNLPYVGLEHIESNTGKFIGSTEPQSVKSMTFNFSDKHVLYGRLRPYLKKVLLPDFEGHCSSEIFPLKVSNQLDRSFLFHWLLSDETTEKINATSTGARMPRANMNTVLDFEIPIPPLPEQQRIVSVLDEAFASIAQAKSNAERNLVNARELFEAAVNEIFGNSGEEWEEKTIEEIADIEYGYTDKAQGSGKFRYIRITDIDKNGNLIPGNKMYVDGFKEASNFLLQDGDLLMARTGATFAKVLLYEDFEPSVFASYLIRIKFTEKILNKLYWYYSKSKLYWGQANQLSSGSAQPQFNGGALKQVVFPYPKSLAEQRAIVGRLEALSAETGRLEEIYEAKVT
ncbi:MAG: restriction endonuclease subunit S [Chloroflexi bacterium]|nr:restriction endonuclease subunit S [Chloroflexota bacterium]